MSIFDRLKDGFDLSDIPGILSDLQKSGINLGDLLNQDFLQKYTDFGQKDNLLSKIGVQNTNQITDVLKNPEKKAKADEVVNQNSQFSSLTELMEKALKNQKK
ncbi:hypothetical protein [Enterococcus mediterraneensis]|uniref:hypothetical protein n=1 Tax=Enterococcus mediterraneensis TaxID=2364791 RepID=UPI000F0672D0|nr:hypothetical protein [Enterococcus mediterraneensis]